MDEKRNEPSLREAFKALPAEEEKFVSEAMLALVTETTRQGENKDLVEHAKTEQRRKGGRSGKDPDKTCKLYEVGLSAGWTHDESLQLAHEGRPDVNRSTVYRHLEERSEIYRKNTEKK